MRKCGRLPSSTSNELDWREEMIGHEAQRLGPQQSKPATPENSHLGMQAEKVIAPTLAVPEQECTQDDNVSEVPCVALSLVSSTRL